jgi:branched-chain amino acid transport system substrate-binding protein
VANAKRLVERDKVFIMMGHLGTPTTKAIMGYLEEHKVPNVFPATLASLWATSGKWHVGDVATYADQTWLIIDYLVKERKLTRIASFYQDDEYGLDGHLAGKARLQHYGLEYIAEVDYKRADIDFSSQAAKLKASGAGAVILQAVYREPPRLAEQCHAMGYNPLFIGPSPIVLDKTIELGGKHVEDVIGVEVWPPPTDPGPFLDQYRADMQKYAPHLPLDMTNLYGYQKAALFVEALQRTGRDLTRESLLQAITTIKDWDPGWGLKYSYGGDDRRVMSRAARLVMVKEGKWVRMSDWMELEEGGRR